jgi:hypothetical protein
MTQPTIGRIVHHQQGDRVVAAIITGVHEDGVNLTVFEPGRLPGYVSMVSEPGTPAVVPFAEVPTPWHWNWPPRM